MRIGVLALQGDFAKHTRAIEALGVAVQEVRKRSDLDGCGGLIIPGGESTTMLRQIAFAGLREPLLAFAEKHPVFGTCAGLILMSQTVRSSHLHPLRLLDVEVERNAFGRQVDSFQALISLELFPGDLEEFPAFFIRAPRIRICGEKVQVLAQWEGEPILVRQGHHLGATFHPELTSNLLVHQYFIDMI